MENVNYVSAEETGTNNNIYSNVSTHSNHQQETVLALMDEDNEKCDSKLNFKARKKGKI